jgi:hypothetical protein
MLREQFGASNDVGHARGPTVHDCRLIDFPRIRDPRGDLTVVEGGSHIPFEIRRVYYLYDVPPGAERGGHAHKDLQQVFIAMSGSFDVLLDDGRESRTVRLDRPFVGLYVTRMIWRTLERFSPGSVCTVLASERYTEADYYRSYETFRAARFPSGHGGG